VSSEIETEIALYVSRFSLALSHYRYPTHVVHVLGTPNAAAVPLRKKKEHFKRLARQGKVLLIPHVIRRLE
jgi:hypothetical protein